MPVETIPIFVSTSSPELLGLANSRCSINLAAKDTEDGVRSGGVQVSSDCLFRMHKALGRDLVPPRAGCGGEPMRSSQMLQRVHTKQWLLMTALGPHLPYRTCHIGCLVFPGTPSSAQAGILVLAVPSWNRSSFRSQPKPLISSTLLPAF